jgi:uncharacterized oligopeptide transporter (OPT) family protein
MTQETDSDKCKHCGNPLPPDHDGPCPKCGKKGKVISISVHDFVHVQSVATATLTTIREFYEKNPKPMAVVILITICSSLVGLFIAGILGVLAGLCLGALSFVLGPKAVIKVREIDRG